MAANTSIANPRVIPDSGWAVSQASKPKLKTLLERTEEMLRRAFGDDEKTVANSLRGL